MFQYYEKDKIGNLDYAFTSHDGGDRHLGKIKEEFNKNGYQWCSTRDLAKMLMKEGAFRTDFESRFDGHIIPSEKMLFVPKGKKGPWEVFLVREGNKFPVKEEVSRLLEDSVEYPFYNESRDWIYLDTKNLYRDKILRFLFGEEFNFAELFGNYLQEAGIKKIELIPEFRWDVQGPGHLGKKGLGRKKHSTWIEEFKPFTQSIFLSVGSIEGKVVGGMYVPRGIRIQPWAGINRTIYGIRNPKTADEAVIQDLENKGHTDEEIRGILNEVNESLDFLI